MLVDVIENYDEEKKKFLLDLREKIIKDLSLHNDTTKIISFLGKCGIISIDDQKQKIYIWVPNEFVKSQIKKFYQKKLNESIRQIYNINFSVGFYVYSKFQTWKHPLQTNIRKLLGVKQTSSTQNQKLDTKTKNNLENIFWVLFDPRYQFENFVVGSHNELAFSAANSIAQDPGKVYNPFFIYWDVGLGKTHLLQAIWNYVIKNHKEKVVVYLPTTKLIDEIVEAIRKNNLSKITKKLEEVDILILDDIQFLAGKDKTQEIFHNIFNDFHTKNKQIILSSDRPPKELNLLEARLRSRFSLWLVSDIKLPDYETRIAILQSKIKYKWENLESSFLEIIAKYVVDNVRELEGALNIILTRKNLLKKDELSENDIYNALDTLWYDVSSKEKQQAVIKNAGELNNKGTKSFNNLVEYIANYYDVSVSDIKWESRKKDVSTARQMLMYIAKNHYGWTLEKIGDYFGGKNHATVIYAIKNFDKTLKNNNWIYQDYQKIINEI